MQIEREDRRSLSLEKVLDGELDVPNVVLTPLRDGGVRVTATFPLLVLREGESRPRLEGKIVEVSPGSVVKAGPALLCYLDAGRARDVRRGALEIPHIVPEPMSDSEKPSDDGSFSMEKLAAALRWGRVHRTYLVVAAACLFVAGFTAYRMMAPPLREGRVLVALRGLPDGDEELVRRSLDDRLRSVGLEPVFYDTLVTPSAACRTPFETTNELEDCARSIGAPNIVSFTMDFSEGDSLAHGRLTSHVARLGRVRPHEPRSVEIESAPGDGVVTSMWIQGLEELVPITVSEVSVSHAGMDPYTPYSLSSPF